MMVDLSYYPGHFLWMKYTFLVLWLGKVHDSLPEHEMFTNLTLKSQLNVLWSLYRRRYSLVERWLDCGPDVLNRTATRQAFPISIYSPNPL